MFRVFHEKCVWYRATLPRQSSPEGHLLVVSSFSLLPKLMIGLGAWLWIHCPLSRSGCNATLDRVAARIHTLGTSALFIPSWDVFSAFCDIWCYLVVACVIYGAFCVTENSLYCLHVLNVFFCGSSACWWYGLLNKYLFNFWKLIVFVFFRFLCSGNSVLVQLYSLVCLGTVSKQRIFCNLHFQNSTSLRDTSALGKRGENPCNEFDFPF